MNAPRIVGHGWRLAALLGLSLPGNSPAQEPTPPGHPPAVTPARPGVPAPEGPIHEALLSPSKDHEPTFVEKAPPAALNERPGDAPPSKTAVSLPGYWDWDPKAEDHVWVAGTWREPPPGRFWAHGYWRREPRGWYRVPGFWTDRPLGQIRWRKQGPPAEQPVDEPGPPPGEGRFYIPGRYVPEGDGVAWKKGFWTRDQPGWAWEPSQWVRQPEGWTVQEGFWDRPPEARGTRFAQLKPGGAAQEGDTIYQPRSSTAPAQSIQTYRAAAQITSSRGGYFRPDYDPSNRIIGAISPGNNGPGGGQSGNPFAAPTGYLPPAASVNNNNPGYVSGPSSANGLGGYPYYGHGVGYSPGYYGTSSFGSGVGYYPGYYGGSGSQAGQQGIQQGGLGGYPYYGHGLGYYPGYYGP